MRVLQVIQELEWGGAERVVLALRDGLLARGDEVAVASAAGPISRSLGLPDVELPTIGRRPWALIGGMAAVGRAIRATRPDVVHAHNPTMALLTGIATRRGRRVPVVATCHGVPESDYATAARMLRVAGAPVVACGPGVSERLVHHGLDPTVVCTVVNGISPPPPPLDRASLVRELDLDEAAPLVVSVGRLAPQKNHALAVQAVSRLAGVSLAIVGSGPCEHELRELIDRTGVGGRVRLTGGRDDARGLLAAADVALLTSDWEGLPLVALEALAAGVPLVATNVVGVRELLADGRDALLVPPGDATAAAAAISRLVNDRDLRRRLIENGRTVADAHTEQRMVESYRAIYDGVAS